MKLTVMAQKIHARALYLSKVHKKVELDLLEILNQVRALKIDRALGYTSLFNYASEALSLSEAQAYAFCAVVRASEQFPVLKQTLNAGRLSVYKASRVVSALDVDNAEQVIEFAATHSTRETEKYVTKLRPRALRADRMRPVTEHLFELRTNLSDACLEKLKRVQDLQASCNKNTSYADVIEAALEEYLFKHDPVAKAQRSRAQHKPSSFCARKKRQPFSAAQKHTVHRRDQAQCTHIDEHGRRCLARRWLHIHHIRPVSQGGDNSPENLTTLCAAHHDLVHQLSFAIEGQRSWLREPVVEYRAY